METRYLTEQEKKRMRRKRDLKLRRNSHRNRVKKALREEMKL